MKKKVLDYLERMRQIEDQGICYENEFYSVGMLPPAEEVLKYKAVRRKIDRLERQMKVAQEGK